VASHIAKVYPKQNLSLLIHCQTPYPANKASPNNSVSCCGIYFGEGRIIVFRFKTIEKIRRTGAIASFVSA